ncbi:MAG: helix-turn-helix domain-containing protein [bacterium]
MRMLPGSFEFTPEMGERLRRLRKGAGITIKQMAAALGYKKPGAAGVIWRLEAGKNKNPGLGLIVDYLRVCGTGFKEIVDLLDSYPPQPVERTKVKAKVELEPAKPKFVRTPEQKAERNRKAYVLKLLRRDVEEMLYTILLNFQDELKRTSQCQAICQSGRRWFDILWRTRERPRSRQRQLQKELSRQTIEGVKPAWIEHVRRRMEELFKEKVESLPEIPDNAHPGMLATVARAEDRFLSERLRARFLNGRLRLYRLAMFAPDILTYLQGEGIHNTDIQRFNLGLFPELMRICEETEGKPAERQRRIDELIQPWLKFPQTPVVVRMFLHGYEKWKNWH